jgi:hypothetical protein
VLRRQPLVTGAQCQILRGLEESLRPLGVFFQIHERTPFEPAAAPPSGSRRGLSLAYMGVTTKAHNRLSAPDGCLEKRTRVGLQVPAASGSLRRRPALALG